MAYDKIITIHNRLDHCVDYVLNEEKNRPVRRPGIYCGGEQGRSIGHRHQLRPGAGMAGNAGDQDAVGQEGRGPGVSYRPLLCPRRGNAPGGPRRWGGVCPPSAGETASRRWLPPIRIETTCIVISCLTLCPLWMAGATAAISRRTLGDIRGPPMRSAGNGACQSLSRKARESTTPNGRRSKRVSLRCTASSGRTSTPPSPKPTPTKAS